jgi:hypothetical protein
MMSGARGGVQQFLQSAGGPPGDIPMVDNAETVYISSLALLKMLKHGKLFLSKSVNDVDC